MPDRFRGRRAVVTGSSRGIGAAIAERLAAEGADVVLTARTLDHHETLAGSLTETADRLARYGTTVGIVVADLTDPEDRLRVIPEAAEVLGGPVEILVNNAAASIQAPLTGFSVKRRNIMFEVNVNAPLDLALAAVPAMVDAGEGWIVNLSSGSARHWEGPPFDVGPAGPRTAAYGASKAALNRISNGLAAELYGTGIRVNTVEPRAAVLSEGAAALVGSTLRPDQIESMEEMVEGTVVLCDCDADVTGRTTVSLDNIAEWGLAVHDLDGSPR
ncbi:MAG: SDR family NAD(P)-dependent oxidoreductase [Acidimicrobiales bacterium]|jgi:NAD(P)-dependent dehydrogenase (short-subunit alcohol dehydrogenase family)|nr:SDR family NAD(P)-dependent oxidoreductase [Acidimicrobiales bacterium]